MTSRRRLQGLAHSSRGQGLVEFAMVLPLLLTVGFIITEFGRALWLNNVLAQACREGCREALIAGPANAEAAGRAAALRYLESQKMAGTGVNNAAGVQVRVIADPNDANFQLVEVECSRMFFLVPTDTPTQPFGEAELADTQPQTSLSAGQILIRSRSVMMLADG